MPSPSDAIVEEVVARLNASRLPEIDKLLDRISTLESAIASLQKDTPGKASEERKNSEQDTPSGPALRAGASVKFDYEGSMNAENVIAKRHLEASTWEAIVLVGLDCTGRVESVLLTVAYVVNIVLQLVFCSVALTSFTQDQSQLSLDGARDFRINLGQNYWKMDPTSFVSLQSRVCNLDPSLEVATAQVSALKFIREYTDEYLGLGVSAGAVLCVVVLAVWYLVFVFEVHSTLDFTSTTSMVLGSCSRIVYSDGSDEALGFKLESIGRGRFGLVVFSAVLRFAVASLLFVSGSLWLANTQNIKDLVLNAAALEFVIHLDELTFATLAPTAVKTLIEHLGPLKKPLPNHAVAFRRRGGLRSVVSLVVGIVAVILFFIHTVKPMTDSMKQIDDEMCIKGSTNFVVGLDGMGCAWGIKTKPFGFKGNLTFLQYTITENLDKGVGNVQAVKYETTLQGINDKIENYDWDYGTSAPCLDAFDVYFHDEGVYINEAIRFDVGMPDATTCQEMEHHCDKEGSKLLRVMCSVTCGCASSVSSLTSNDGCQKQCSSNRAEELESISCQDTHPDVEAFRGFRANMAVRVNPLLSEDFEGTNCSGLLQVMMTTLGKYDKASVCADTLDIRGLAKFCPETCGCLEEPDQEMCAPTCSPTYKPPENDCTDTASGHPMCTYSGLCDCLSFTETYPCGSVIVSRSGNITVNDVCSKSCGVCTPSCTDTAGGHPMCTYSGLCDCSSFIETYPCGSVIVSRSGNITVDDVCSKSCGVCAPKCTDTASDHPMCTYSGLCDCSSFTKTYPCGSVIVSRSGNITVNDVCSNFCGVCT